MDFINKLINRPKSLPASTAAGMASDIQIESLLAEIQENLNHKNQVRRIIFTKISRTQLFCSVFVVSCHNFSVKFGLLPTNEFCSCKRCSGKIEPSEKLV